ncbi:MAG TPA: VanZ family protein [Pyrinomonadaceae bacterium]|jgi:VanZ family protein
MIERSEKGRETANLPGEVATWRGRARRYLPLLLWIGFILFASTGSLSATNTSRIVRPLLLWLNPDITEESLLYAHLVVRKTAHLFEYAVLAVLAARAFLTSTRAVLRRHWYAVAFALVALVAVLDEYHQSFVETRTGTPYDSLIDVTGGALGLALVGLWRRLRYKKSNRAGRAQALKF